MIQHIMHLRSREFAFDSISYSFILVIFTARRIPIPNAIANPPLVEESLPVWTAKLLGEEYGQLAMLNAE